MIKINKKNLIVVAGSIAAIIMIAVALMIYFTPETNLGKGGVTGVLSQSNSKLTLVTNEGTYYLCAPNQNYITSVDELETYGLCCLQIGSSLTVVGDKDFLGSDQVLIISYISD